MKYVDWVERVLCASVEAFDAGGGFSTDESEIAAQIGYQRDDIAEPLADAIRDLGNLGLLDVRSRGDIRLRPEARKIRVASLATTWPGFIEIWLEEDAEQFLSKLVELSEQQEEAFAYLREVEAEEVLLQLATKASRGDAEAVVTHLAQLGLVDASGATFGLLPVFPTYPGIVRVTERVTTEGQMLVDRLLEDWETTNTEFKRELHLDSNDEKAEFIRDLLSLANTQVTGDRHLITGFDPKSHEFTTTADPRITQDRIEDVINRYIDPPLAVKYQTFPSADDSGEIGAIEIRRDRAKVPYRVKADLKGSTKGIRAGQVFVRHNSHVAEASPEEVADLEAEARYARGMG